MKASLSQGTSLYKLTQSLRSRVLPPPLRPFNSLSPSLTHSVLGSLFPCIGLDLLDFPSKPEVPGAFRRGDSHLIGDYS